jgi:outer membrane receptor for ferric coprogen and ferric-rhodotorulic acid
VRSKGIELEVQGQLTPDWQLAAGYTFAEAKYVKDTKKENEGRLFDTDIPRHLFKMSTSHTAGAIQPVACRCLPLSPESNLQQEHHLHDRAGWLHPGGLHVGFKPTEHIDARVNLNNAFDKKYYNALSNSVAVPSNVYGEPRNLMLSLKYTF